MLAVSRRDTDNQLWLINVRHKVRANGRNNSQHCWPNHVGSCCDRLHVAKRLTGCATTPKNAQQHATGCANGRNMKHPTMLGDTGQQWFVQLHRAMQVLSNVQVDATAPNIDAQQ